MNPQAMFPNNFTATATKYFLPDPKPTVLSSSNILFVADLPDDTCQEDLSNFFKDYNYITSRIINSMTHTHSFVHFLNRDSAEKARNELNGVKLTPKYAKSKIAKPVRLCKYESKDSMAQLDSKCNLLVKNLAKTFSAHKLFLTFKKFGDIRSSRLMIDILGESKGFGFVSFYRKDDAEKAKNELDGKEFDGKKMKVNFLEKGRKNQAKKNNIYVKHIPKENFDEKNLKELFEKYGEITSAIVLKDDKGQSKGFGFVCFANPDDAEKAIKEMKDQKIFDNVEEKLYVSFAMKKGERKELLLKKRQELFKLAQKMTIYAKIKDENEIESESDFEDLIMVYLKKLLGDDFKPKYIKIQMEKKNAFITMNSQKESEDFVKKFHEFSLSNENKIYFNLYKPKVDRVNASSYFKKYNQFSETGSLTSGSKRNTQKYQTFNNFDVNTGIFTGPMNQKNPQMPMPMGPPKPTYMKYNNFPMNGQIPPQFMNPQPGREPQMPMNEPHPHPQMQPNNFEKPNWEQIPPEEERGLDQEDEKERLGEAIYEIASQMFPRTASKITGMIIEFPPEKVKSMLDNKLNDLKVLIKDANEQILKSELDQMQK